MPDDNPYNAPASPTGDNSGPMPLVWSVLAVLGSAILFGLLGMGIGAALGLFFPGYYRSVFSSGGDPGFDPVAVGIGQGLTQGIVLGGVVGLVLVAMFYWHRAHKS